MKPLKSVLSLSLAFFLLLSLSACKPQSEEDVAGMADQERYEAYAMGTRGTYTFASYEHIDRVAVLAPEDMDAFLHQKVGDLSTLELRGAQALVLDYTGEIFRVYVVSGRNEVLYFYDSAKAGSAGSRQQASVKDGRSLSELRQEYAQLSVYLDNFDERYLEEDAEPFPEEAAALYEELGDACFLDPRYLALEAKDTTLRKRTEQYLEPLYLVSLYIEQKSAEEGLSESEVDALFAMQLERRDLQRGLIKIEAELAAVEASALAILEENAALVEAIKADTQEELYQNDTRFLQLTLAHSDLNRYVSQQQAKAAQEKLLELYEELMEESHSDVIEARLARHAVLAENQADQAAHRTALAKALLEQEQYLTEYGTELAEYEAAVKAIAAGYERDEYLEDIDYLKLNIVNEDLLTGREAREAAVLQAKADLEAATAEYAELEAAYAELVEERMLAHLQTEQTALLQAFLGSLGPALCLDEEGNPVTNDADLEGWQEMPEEFVAQMDEARRVKSSSSSSGGTGGTDSFEDYLKENDQESYEFYQGLQEGWNSGTWDPENGFFQP